MENFPLPCRQSKLSFSWCIELRYHVCLSVNYKQESNFMTLFHLGSQSDEIHILRLSTSLLFVVCWHLRLFSVSQTYSHLAYFVSIGFYGSTEMPLQNTGISLLDSHNEITTS